MDNRQSLQEYLSNFRTIEEKRKVYFYVSCAMHHIHNDGEYFPRLLFRDIRLCYTNITDVHFAGYQKIGFHKIEETLAIKMKNILELAQLMVCSYIDYDFNNPIIFMEVLEKNLDSLESFFHPHDFTYLKKVIVDKEYIYYDDYISRLENSNNFQVFESNIQGFTNYFLLIVNITTISIGLIFLVFLLYLY